MVAIVLNRGCEVSAHQLSLLRFPHLTIAIDLKGLAGLYQALINQHSIIRCQQRNVDGNDAQQNFEDCSQSGSLLFTNFMRRAAKKSGGNTIASISNSLI
jgi:hypothetical protein